MRKFLLMLALVSQEAGASCTPPPAPGQCWMRKEDVGLSPDSYSIRKITAINATKYSYFPILQGYRLSQDNDYLSELTEKFQPIPCPESFND